MPWTLWDYVDVNGVNVIRAWYLTLEKKQRAKLDSKLQMLKQVGPDLPPGILSDTGIGHISKIRVNGDVALRPMVCKGPINTGSEYTLLYPATEKDRKLIPPDAAKKAAIRRIEVLADPIGRRCSHD